MGGRGASSGAGRASNTKYHGFKVASKDGKEMNLVIENGVVKYADGSENPTRFLGNELDVFQNFYDREGSEQAIIDRINKIGNAKAGILSDKAVNDLREKRRKGRAESRKNYSPRNSKKGVNRKSAYWSAM
ncbi:MAG: hypothetical protein MR671_04745 [Clostridiales bacterium]|nr:hypothetical protein [Clostridiales bacterium]